MLYSIIGIDYHKNRALSTKSFENTLISAGCKKRQGKLWQKKRGLDDAYPLDKAIIVKKFRTHLRPGFVPVLLFRNSYRSTDPLPPPVTPPYVPDKPTPTPKPVDQPGEITVIRPPTPSAEMPDEVIPAAEPEPVGTLIQTGQLLWPVPVLAGGGIALVAAGLWLSRKRRHDA